jgi:hypothetical protein
MSDTGWKFQVPTACAKASFSIFYLLSSISGWSPRSVHSWFPSPFSPFPSVKKSASIRGGHSGSESAVKKFVPFGSYGT